MLTTPLIIIFFSLLIIVHEIGHFLLAKRFGLFVGEFGLGLPPRAWGKKIGETVYSINWLPFGGFVKIAGEDGAEDVDKKLPHDRIFYNIAPWKRLLILIGGVGMNFLFGWALLAVVFMIGVEPGVFITQVQPGGPADSAGLRTNDRLVDFVRSDDFVRYTKEHAGEAVALRIVRDKKTLTVQMTPRKDPPTGQGPLGVMLGETVGHEKQEIGGAVKGGFIGSINIAQETIKSIGRLLAATVVGKGSMDGITGPIGIVKITADVSQTGFAYTLSLVALISINLAVFNILPLPALDGGRVLFLVVEKLKGSPLPKKFEQYANGIGLLLLLGLILVVSVKDVIRLLWSV